MNIGRSNAALALPERLREEGKFRAEQEGLRLVRLFGPRSISRQHLPQRSVVLRHVSNPGPSSWFLLRINCRSVAMQWPTPSARPGKYR